MTGMWLCFFLSSRRRHTIWTGDWSSDVCSSDLLLTRNKKEITATYPEVAAALAGQPDIDFVADGEIVAFERGRTSFARLQQRMQVAEPEPELISAVRVYFYLFDLMFVGGHDIR